MKKGIRKRPRVHRLKDTKTYLCGRKRTKRQSTYDDVTCRTCLRVDEINRRKKYIPKVGDHVHARRRKEVAKEGYNTRPIGVVGPIVEIHENSTRIVTNKGTGLEGDFILRHSDYTFYLLERGKANG